MHSRLTPLLLTTALAACATVGPDPTATPAPDLPAAYVGSRADSAAAPLAQTPFWTAYRDTMLNGLIEQGLTQSLDLLSAQQSIRAAEADLRGRGVAASQLSGSASAGWTRAQTNGAIAEGHSTSLGAALVFDMFGGALRQRQASAAALEASHASAEATRLAWLAEVIDAYGSARYYQQALELTRQTIRSREQIVRITADKVDIGTATGLALIQARASLESARAELPSGDAQFAAQVFRLATLLDRPAGPLMTQMQRGAPPLRIPATPSAGVPADLLRNRPDVRQAELALVQSLAAVGVATANMLPSITLSGTVSDNGSATNWSFGPQLSLPVFGQTALRATRDRRLAEAAQAEIAWRASVAAAVEDVQVAQSNLRRTRMRIDALQAALRSQEEAYELSLQSFQDGSVTLIDLLDVESARSSARASVLSAQHEAAQQWAVLTLAIGAAPE